MRKLSVCINTGEAPISEKATGAYVGDALDNAPAQAQLDNAYITSLCRL